MFSPVKAKYWLTCSAQISNRKEVTDHAKSRRIFREIKEESENSNWQLIN